MTENLPTATNIYPTSSLGWNLESVKQWGVNNWDWAVPAVIVVIIAGGLWLWAARKKSAPSNTANQKQGNDNNYSPQNAASGSGATAIQQHIYNTFNGEPVEKYAKVLAENIDLKRQLEQTQAAVTAAANNPDTSDVLRQRLTKASDLLQQGKMAELQKLLQPIEREQAATMAAIQDMIAVSYMATKDFLNAEIYYRKAYTLQPDSDSHAHNLGWVLSEQRKYSEALSYYEQAEKIARKDPQNHEDLAMTLNNLGALHLNMGKFEEAEKALTEALQLYRALTKTNPDAYNSDLGMTLNNLGILHSDTGRFEEAGEAYGEALQLRRALAKTNPDAYNPNLAMTLNNLGTLHLNMERFEEAGEAYTEALRLYRALAESNPDAYNPNLAGTLNNLSNLHLNMGRFEEAEKAYTEALRLYRALAKKYPDAYNPSLKGVENNIEKLEQLKKQQEAA